jgi:dimethylhistidine N-methyltransferase
MSTPASAPSKSRIDLARGIREFAADVCAGLRKPQKELHSKYLYDELGSALFEAITYLPEYGLTRADERLLAEHAADIAELIAPPVTVIELGSGAGRKTRPILTALRPSNPGLRYFPIDVSAEALERCRRELDDVADVRPLPSSYLDGLASAVAARVAGEGLLILFLGSTIGNFEPPCALEFLRDLRRALEPGDALLVGADLIKEPKRMLPAYDDPTGVTGAFNLNLLGRINRELGGTFELPKFEHQARWNEQQHRIEMHLRSRVDQTVEIRECGLAVALRTGETIWTESSHKFHPADLSAMAEATGFHVTAQWVDQKWPFAESLWTVR